MTAPNNDRLFELVLQHPDVVRQPDGNGEATAWCPWHADKGGAHPNLGINAKKKIVKCFVCGKGGIRVLAEAWHIVDKAERKAQQAPREPYYSEVAAMNQLAVAYGLRPGTIAHWKIEAATTYVSPDRTKRGAWRYQTHCGVRYKAFDRTPGQKYWWGKGTDAEKRQAMLYGAGSLPPNTITVTLVNGEPSVWECWQAGIPAVCAFGEGNLPAAAVKQLYDHGVRNVRVVLDLDKAGELGAFRNLKLFREAGIEATAYRLPEALGEKADVGDLYASLKFADAPFVEAMATLREYEPTNPDPLDGTRYSIEAGHIVTTQATREGDTTIVLSNFVAWATEEVLQDDGVEPVLYLTIHGELAGSRRHLPDVSVALADFMSLGWIPNAWGAAPIIKAGQSSKEQIREVIQIISLGKGLPRRTEYTHTGWRKLDDGTWRFLLPNGPDEPSPDGVEVHLSNNYRRFHLPGHAVPDPVGSVKASLRFLDVGDQSVTFPLLTYAYLAPLQSILEPPFALWVRAQTGSFKSTIVALLMCHFGEFEFNTPTATWDATARGIERMLFDLKDIPLWIDDFAPKSSPKDAKDLNNKAEIVLRSFGNRQARIRMLRSTKSADSLPPRSLLISTAELYPTGKSVLARFLPIDYSKNAIDHDQLDMAQAEQDRYRFAMAHYVQWIAPQYDTIAKRIRRAVADQRNADYDAKEHARLPQATAIMTATFDLLMEFALDVEAIGPERAQELRAKARWVFGQIAGAHANRIADEDPVSRFFNIIDTMLAQHQVAFLVKGSHSDVPYPATHIGWYDNDYVYLMADGSWKVVMEWLRGEEGTLGADKTTLRQALLEKHILDPVDAGRLASRISTNGRDHRVLRLKREHVPFAAAFDGGSVPTAPAADQTAEPEPERMQL